MAESVEGVLEEARTAVVRMIVHTYQCPANATWENDCTCGRVANVDTLIAAARSGHDGLPEAETQIAQLRADLGHIRRTAEDPYNYDGHIAKLAARALSPEAK